MQSNKWLFLLDFVLPLRTTTFLEDLTLTVPGGLAIVAHVVAQNRQFGCPHRQRIVRPPTPVPLK